MISEVAKARARYAAMRREYPAGYGERQAALSAWYTAMEAAGLDVAERDAALAKLASEIPFNPDK